MSIYGVEKNVFLDGNETQVDFEVFFKLSLAEIQEIIFKLQEDGRRDILEQIESENNIRIKTLDNNSEIFIKNQKINIYLSIISEFPDFTFHSTDELFQWRLAQERANGSGKVEDAHSKKCCVIL